MCILCVVQKWSRRVATVLPWLLFPLPGLWGVSHLMPPGFRFEFTSPRIACVLVLLVTVFWYEVLIPQLSAWRARNSAKYREMKRRDAIEMHKLRKTATRLCRNCLAAYRDQNPCGGKFMCSYCGHVSKRPVLNIPSGNGGDVEGKGGMKECLGIGCVFGNDASQNGNSTRVHFALRSNCKAKNAAGISSISAAKASNLIFVKFARFWRNIFGLAVEDDTSSDGDDDMLFKEGQNGINFQESRGEKARRKAEEKRQARLERELLEEEERKQREEVAKLVEEQRKLRDEKMDAEKEAVKGSSSDREKCSKREVELKRLERRKERDQGSSKSNSDCEDFERKAGKINDKKRESDKKSESGRRDLNKTANLCVKVRNSEVANVSKVSTTQNHSNGNSTRYLDHVKGSFMSSSKAFNGSSLFGKDALACASVSSKAGHHIDHQTASSRKEIHDSEHVNTKLNDKISKTTSYQPVTSEFQPQVTSKKSWRQLFTRSPAVPSSHTESLPISNQKIQSIAQRSFLPGQASPSHPLADQISFGLPLPFSLSPFPNGSKGCSPVYSSVAEPVYPHVGDSSHDLMSEEPDVFEDPCYVPESLLGPVSESLDSFPLDLGRGLMKDRKFEQPYDLKYLSPSFEISKPSPIEAPVSRLRCVEEKHASYNSYPNTPKRENANASPLTGQNNEHEEGTWKMWSTPPLGHDGFGLLGGCGGWLLPLGQNTSSQEEVFHLPAYNTLTLPFHKENQVRSDTSSSQGLHPGNYQNGGTFSLVAPGSNENDPWLQRNIFQPSSRDGQDQFHPIIPWEDSTQENVNFCASNNSSSSHSSELSPANRWPKKDSAVNGVGEGIGNPLVSRPHIGGLFSTPDVDSLWSYN